MERTTFGTKVMTACGLVAAAGLVAFAFPKTAEGGGPGGNGGQNGNYDPNAPNSISITGVIRDFRERRVPGGHTDFERRPDAGFGHYMGNVADALDADGKPVFTGGGYRVNSQWRAGGLNIHPNYFNASAGDTPGSAGVVDNGGIESQDTFRQWFRDIPGVNATDLFPITLRQDGDTGNYIFDDRLDSHFAHTQGFFPVNGKLLGNAQGGNKNFHFTFELRTEFQYDASAGMVFKFRGDDDVWVFIDGKVAIDIGGVHSAVEQNILLDRLGLVDGETYELAFFFAERHRTQSNFRIETNIPLRTGTLPAVTSMHD